MSRKAARARIVFLIRVLAADTERFLAAYERIRYEVAGGVPGHVLDQVCQSPADPEQWLITSEWESLEHFVAWERSPGHRELAGPMRACMAEAKSIKFEIREETANTTLRRAG
ncbi:antibiotic biosynthesis monooxygenase family protein [Actinophytocola sediminis]